ncbi:hypothetical protein ICU98_06860 [Polynucleobacter sp. MWH-P3-07-1]|uniref:hypothetical protein n=1 Tax=Polynucleobacter sp. MWH-P3-07-1 TaxID=1743173 RepID=UPI001BFD44E5|nr:hypothetical protein [Polynucleobacter sp. MWH-P3-07-1]QWD83149.1 hypothetical protein ICU98_06860 [Polynucleobacter sp. MWH-P3-07-1]
MATSKKSKIQVGTSESNRALKTQEKLLEGLYRNDFSYYVYKMTRLEVYYWLKTISDQKDFDKVADLIFHAKLDDLFGKIDRDMGSDKFLYQIIFREIRNGNDGAIRSFEDPGYTDYEVYDGIDTYSKLSDSQKLIVWMEHVSGMTDHQPFPMLANIP